jgi:hypothetical protein
MVSGSEDREPEMVPVVNWRVLQKGFAIYLSLLASGDFERVTQTIGRRCRVAPADALAVSLRLHALHRAVIGDRRIKALFIEDRENVFMRASSASCRMVSQSDADVAASFDRDVFETIMTTPPALDRGV